MTSLLSRPVESLVGRHMRAVLKVGFLVVAALVVAAIPTRLGSHEVAVGFPFTWRTSQQIITLGQQPHTFSLLLLLFDFCIALLVLAAGATLLRIRRT